MPDKTLHDLPLATSAAADDELELWVTASSILKRITKSNLMGGVLTGGGALATGGYTLTVPATGTAALLGGAQTLTGLKTFSAGISFGQDTLAYYDEGTWTPTITGSSSNPTVAYSTQIGQYTRIGNRVLYNFNVSISTISGGGGDIRVSLPLTAAAFAHFMAPVYTSGVDFPAATINAAFAALSGAAYGTIYAFHDDTVNERLQVSALAASDTLIVTGQYIAA